MNFVYMSKEDLVSFAQEILGAKKEAASAISEERFLNVEEAAEYIQVAKQTLYGYSSKGVIPRVGGCRKLLFRKADLDAWLLGQNSKPQTSKS